MLLLITVIILLTYTIVLLMFFMGWCALLPKIAHPRPEVVPFSVVKSPRRNSVFISFESLTSASMQSLHHKLSHSSNSTNPSQPKQRSLSNQSQMHDAAANEKRQIDLGRCGNEQAEKKCRSASTPDSGTGSLTIPGGHSASSRPSSSDLSAAFELPTQSSLSGIPKSTSAQSDYLHPKYSLPPIKIDITDHLLADQHLLRTPLQLKCSRNATKARSRSFDDREDDPPMNGVKSKAIEGQMACQISWQQQMPLANLRKLAIAQNRTPPKCSSTFLLSDHQSSNNNDIQQQQQRLLSAPNNVMTKTIDEFVV